MGPIRGQEKSCLKMTLTYIVQPPERKEVLARSLVWSGINVDLNPLVSHCALEIREIRQPVSQSSNRFLSGIWSENKDWDFWDVDWRWVLTSIDSINFWLWLGFIELYKVYIQVLSNRRYSASVFAAQLATPFWLDVDYVVIMFISKCILENDVSLLQCILRQLKGIWTAGLQYYWDKLEEEKIIHFCS